MKKIGIIISHGTIGIILISNLLIGCQSKRNYNDSILAFLKSVPDIKLPITFADSLLDDYKTNSILVDTNIVKKFIVDKNTRWYGSNPFNQYLDYKCVCIGKFIKNNYYHVFFISYRTEAGDGGLTLFLYIFDKDGNRIDFSGILENVPRNYHYLRVSSATISEDEDILTYEKVKIDGTLDDEEIQYKITETKTKYEINKEGKIVFIEKKDSLLYQNTNPNIIVD